MFLLVQKHECLCLSRSSGSGGFWAQQNRPREAGRRVRQEGEKGKCLEHADDS